MILLSIDAVADWLVRLEREDGLPRIVVRELAKRRGARDRLCRGGLFARRRGGYEFDTDRLRFHYSSMTTPNEV